MERARSVVVVSPDTVIQIQPRPLRAKASVIAHGDGTFTTVIGRVFRPEDVPRCRLCPLGSCSAEHGFCQISYPGLIPDREAALHRAAVVDRD